MAPLRAVLVCWACAALLLLPGCDGKGLMQDLLGSYKSKLQTDGATVSSGAKRAFDVEVADASERVVAKPAPKASSSRKGKSSSSSSKDRKSDKHGISYMLSDIQRIVTGRGGAHKGRDRSDAIVPECPPHPFEFLSEQDRLDTPLKSWIAAGIEVRTLPAGNACRRQRTRRAHHPSVAPSMMPSQAPSAAPSQAPSSAPSAAPSPAPSPFFAC